MGDGSLTILRLDEVVAGLSMALRAEWQAVADYRAHAQACDRPEIREALEILGNVEREHAARLAQRISALGGSTASEAAVPQPMNESLPDWLEQDLASEQWAIVEYARLVACIADDTETVELMTELLLDEIRHAGWLKYTLNALGTEHSDATTQAS